MTQRPLHSNVDTISISNEEFMQHATCGAQMLIVPLRFRWHAVLAPG